MPQAKLCAECRHPKSHHRTASCRHTWQAMGATFMGNRIITHWCGESAEEWAYNGGCPRELICPRRQLRYSPDPERYSPRCKSCHLAQDRVRDEKGRLASKGGDAQ